MNDKHCDHDYILCDGPFYNTKDPSDRVTVCVEKCTKCQKEFDLINTQDEPDRWYRAIEPNKR